VLNRGADRTVGEAITDELPERIGDQDLWVGGPVQPAALSYLHSDEFLPNANVCPNLNLDHSLEDLVELGNSFSSTQRVRVFTGYSGWGPGQLEDEMERKAWVTHTATIEHVFEKSPEELWRIIMREMGGVNRLMSDAPDDLSWN
jgi:putative transcriptional regulator